MPLSNPKLDVINSVNHETRIFAAMLGAPDWEKKTDREKLIVAIECLQWINQFTYDFLSSKVISNQWFMYDLKKS